MSAVAQHPNTFKAFQVAAGRWLDAKDEQRVSQDAMWAGTMARLFSDFELRLLAEKGYISQYDRQLLAAIGRTPWTLEAL